MDKPEWMQEAEKSGYKVVPESDFTELSKTKDQLQNLRSRIPDGFQGKEDEFFSASQDAIKRLKEIEDGEKTDLEKSNSRISELESQNATLTSKISELESSNSSLAKSNNDLLVGIDLRNEQQRRNITVHPRFVTDELFNKIDRSKFDLNTEDGKKKYSEALFNEVLEPAYKEQQEVAGSVANMNRSQDDGKGNTEGSKKEDTPSLGWGSKA